MFNATGDLETCILGNWSKGISKRVCTSGQIHKFTRASFPTGKEMGTDSTFSQTKMFTRESGKMGSLMEKAR